MARRGDTTSRKNPQRFVIVPYPGERWIYDTLTLRFVGRAYRGRRMDHNAIVNVNKRNDCWMRGT